MPERHLDPLFSLAFDDELDPGARRRFSAHLEACGRCADAWDEYRTALEAVRALPAVTMPATVRLPLGPPEVARIPLLARLRESVLHPPPIWAAGGLAAVAIAAAFLAAHHGGPSSTTGSSSALDRNGLAALAPEAVACPVAPVPSGAQPASFSHSASAAAGSGRELVLATPMDSYAPGASVPIYARLTTSAASGGGSDVVPCVTLETVPANGAAGGAGAPGALVAPAPAPYAPAPGVAYGAPQAPGDRAVAGAPGQAPMDSSTVSPTPIAVATSEPQAFSAAGGAAAVSGSGSSAKQLAPAGPLLSVVIPRNIAPGTVLRLVAVIPPHYPGNPTDAPIQVELFITVR